MVADDVYLIFSSLYWISGLAALFATTLRGATRLITTQPFSAELMLQMIERYKVTSTITAPSQVAMLLQCPDIHSTDLTSLVRYYAAGSAVPEELCQRMNRFLPCEMRVAYGMSEVAGMTSCTVPPRRSGSIGSLIKGIQVRILNDQNELCGPNEDGEISIWIEPPFQGYWNDEESTSALFDVDGWMRSGDIGRFDDDGFFYFVDRKKDMMKYRGYQISPNELEAIVLGCRGVSAVCVVGVPDEELNDLPTALVVRRNDEAEVTEQEIADLVQGEYTYTLNGVYAVL